MGRSAKFHKRNFKSKIKSSTSQAVANDSRPSTATSAPAVAVQIAAKKKDLKRKARSAANKPSGQDSVLGGADYVTLMMGGRKRVREEAKKLPKDD